MMKNLARFGALALSLLCSSSLAASWDDVIAEKTRRADAYRKRAYSLGVDHAGTLYNMVHIPEHTCAILGRLLGQAKLVRHLEDIVYPDASSVDGHELLVASISLDNWVGLAMSLRSEDKARWIKAWNLDCVGHLDIQKSARIRAGSTPNTFYDVDGREGTVLRVLGKVEKGFARRLKDVIRINPKVDTIALGSGGGNVMEALDAGRVIRKNGLKTVLWNDCYSACPIVFMGGVDRVIWDPYPMLGFHQMHRRGMALRLDDHMYTEVAQFVREMGADSRTFISLMHSAPPSKMHNANADFHKLCEAKIVTFVSKWCSADFP